MQEAHGGSTHVPPQEGNSFVLLGELIIFKVAGDRAGASCTVFEDLTQPGYEGPPHRHLRQDENILRRGRGIRVPRRRVHGPDDPWGVCLPAQRHPPHLPQHGQRNRQAGGDRLAAGRLREVCRRGGPIDHRQDSSASPSRWSAGPGDPRKGSAKLQEEPHRRSAAGGMNRY
jgi:hypothetical protein